MKTQPEIMKEPLLPDVELVLTDPSLGAGMEPALKRVLEEMKAAGHADMIPKFLGELIGWDKLTVTCMRWFRVY